MSTSVDELLTQYESGQLSRRGFLAAMATLAAAGASGNAFAQEAPFQVTSLNHVTLFVKDVPQTAALYQKLFGMPVKSYQGNGINLAAGEGSNQFVGLFNGPPGPPRIDHICLGVKNFDVDKAVKVLAEHGLKANVRMRDDKIPELYFNDPNGISIQLQDESYCGGEGVLGNQCEANPQKPV